MLSQKEADNLVKTLKHALREDIFVWENNLMQEEYFKSLQLEKIEFVLNMKRNPFEIRLHLRTRDKNIGLLRLDCAPYHPNPDGTELRNVPHVHYYVENADLSWAKAVDWCDLASPTKTLDRFLNEINAVFPHGHQTSLF